MIYSTLIWVLFLSLVIFIFKDQIRAILESIARIGNKTSNIQYKGVNIALGSEVSSMTVGQQDTLDAKHIELQKAYQSTVITSEEKTIRDQVVDAKLSNEQAINILINHLANKNFLLHMLNIDRFIYNEQIEILLYLNKQIKACAESDLFPFYKKWLEKSKESAYEFNNFLNFLLTNRLISQDMNGYSISILGREYLSLIVRLGRALPLESA
ncbi:MAG: hypothetical protein A3E88_04315 [Legionellales bacterium RIFCSPHIGHO2_12_FULL_35_11]|nr:MAG: hypothetical protein A3E88_04315 [Legionellales bacterium RIFCSPHIGHO2_12_FULL_35_11]